MRYTDRVAKLESEGAFVVLAKAKKLEAEGKSVIHLQIGEPDFETPANISEAAIKAIRDGHTHYAPSGGIPIARQAVADYMNKTRNISVGPEHAVIMPGCKPVIYCTMAALIQDGDEVIIPDPGYPTYRSLTNFFGARPVTVRLREENKFRFSLSDLASAVTPRTRMIVINSPQNPTGGVLTSDDLAGVFEIAARHDLWVLSDEIYSRIIYDIPFESIGSLKGALERCILIDGLSKTYAMTGWRLGFGVMPKKLADYMFTLAINNFSSTATFSQYALMEALQGSQDEIAKMVAEFRRRREAIVGGLNQIEGVSCLRPEGAFYVFANVTGTGLRSQEFADVMLDQAGVACLAGTAFGSAGEGFVRFSYANSVANIEEALRRMKSVLAGMRGQQPLKKVSG